MRVPPPILHLTQTVRLWLCSIDVGRTLAVGDYHTCVTKADTGTLVCFGSAAVPDTLTNIVWSTLEAGDGFTCGITANTNALKFWARQPEALGSYVTGSFPTDGDLYTYGAWAAVSAGSFATCAVAHHDPFLLGRCPVSAFRCKRPHSNNHLVKSVCWGRFCMWHTHI